MNKKQLLEKRKAAHSKIHEIREAMTADDRTEMTTDERSAWEAANTDFDSATAELEVLERMEKVDGVMAKAPGREDTTSGTVSDADQRAAAFQGWANFQLRGEITDKQREAMEATGMNPHMRELDIPLTANVPRTAEEARALTVTTTGGGYTVPEGFVQNLESALLHFGGMREAADILRTSSGNDLPWPTANDTGNSGALLGINTQDATDTDPAFGVVTFGAYKYTSKIVLVPYELLEDSAFDMASYLGRALGERLGRAQNTACTTGTGSSQPNGIVTASTAGKTAASATAITVDELMDLEHSVDIAYRNMPGARWMMNDAVLKYIRQLKDGQSNYLWQAGNVSAGTPDMLLGKPYIVNNDMASTIEASAKTVLFGDLSKYKIREVNGIRMKRLVERYADYDQEGFVALMRFDADLLDAGTNPVKHLIQAAGS